MTRTRYAASGNLPLGGEKKKSEGCTLLVKIARKINPLDDPPKVAYHLRVESASSVPEKG